MSHYLTKHVIVLFTSFKERSPVASKEMVSDEEIKSSRKAKMSVGQRGKPEPPSKVALRNVPGEMKVSDEVKSPKSLGGQLLF